MTKPNTWMLLHPSQTVVSAVVALSTAECDGSSVTLTLRQTSALLTHLRNALAVALLAEMDRFESLGRCAICAAGLSIDRDLLVEASNALVHVRGCGACGEDSWNSCAAGGHHAERTLALIETALGLAQSADAVDPSADNTGKPSTRDE